MPIGGFSTNSHYTILKLLCVVILCVIVFHDSMIFKCDTYCYWSDLPQSLFLRGRRGEGGTNSLEKKIFSKKFFLLWLSLLKTCLPFSPFARRHQNIKLLNMMFEDNSKFPAISFSFIFPKIRCLTDYFSSPKSVPYLSLRLVPLQKFMNTSF